MTVENRKILDEIRGKRVQGWQKAPISEDTGRKLKERDVVLQIRYVAFEVKKPQIKDKGLPRH
jgi:hypothetical protein